MILKLKNKAYEFRQCEYINILSTNSIKVNYDTTTCICSIKIENMEPEEYLIADNVSQAFVDAIMWELDSVFMLQLPFFDITKLSPPFAKNADMIDILRSWESQGVDSHSYPKKGKVQ